jgi:small-conductance mechanosensitive channel
LIINLRESYKGRIKASNHSFYLIEKIRKAAKWERKKKKMATDEKSIASSITPTTLGNLQLNPFKEVEDEGDVDKNVKHDLAEVSSNAYATQVAKKLFEKLSSDQITVQLADIKKCLPLGTKAKEVFELFETEEGNSITKKQMIFVIKSFMVTKLDIFKEKRNLEKSIQDLSIALGNLNKIVTILSILLSILLILAFYGINFDSLLPLTSIILALSFIFGGTAQKLFECIVFLFVVHPFDTGKIFINIGDRIFFEESHYLVEEMHLLTTVLTLDGVKIYYPNSTLSFI